MSNVGRIIIKQIMAMDKFALMSWGVHPQRGHVTFENAKEINGALVLLTQRTMPVLIDENSKLNKVIRNTLGGVVLKTSSYYVVISLNGLDLYDVCFGKLIKTPEAFLWKDVKCVQDVYGDMLIETIDEFIL